MLHAKEGWGRQQAVLHPQRREGDPWGLTLTLTSHPTLTPNLALCLPSKISLTLAQAIWGLVLEKAYAKTFGSYGDICNGNEGDTPHSPIRHPFETHTPFTHLIPIWNPLYSA